MDRKASITKIYSATKSAKDGNFYLSCQALAEGETTAMGKGADVQMLVNLKLSTITDSVKALLADEPVTRDNGNQSFPAKDVESQELGFDVVLRNVQDHADNDGVVWATL